MINEKEILRQEEVDFRGIINRFKRGWPIVVLFAGIWLFIGLVFQLTFPSLYTAKTTVLIEKPKGVSDPGMLVTSSTGFVKPPDDFYYNNQKAVIRSFPIVHQAVNKIGAIAYYKLGLFNKELYKASPIYIELDSTYMDFEKTTTPYGTLFEVRFNNKNEYELEAEGEYPETKAPFEIEGTFQFGEWVSFDKTRFRVLLADRVLEMSTEQLEDVYSDSYGFTIQNPVALTLNYINSFAIEQEELESTVFSVALGGSVPQKQVDFLNALGDFFISDHLERKTQMLKLAIGYLDNELEALTGKLSQSAEDIEVFKTENAITSINHEGSLLLEQTVKLQNDKVNYVVQGKYYDYLEGYLRDNSDFSKLISPQAFGVKDQLMIRLTEELVQLQQELSYYESLGAQSNPAYNRIKADIASNQRTILNSITGFKESNAVLVKDINTRLREIDETTRGLPRAQRQLMELERFFKMNESFYTNLTEKKADAEIALVSTTPNFRILEPAYLTSLEPMPKAPLTLAIALFLGLLFAFGYLIFKWVFNNSIDSAREIYNYVPGAQIVGEIFRTNITNPSDLANYPDSTLASQLGAILYRLKRKHPDGQVFAISSIQGKEGKTLTSAMLAMLSSMNGYKTLLVDANIKNPNIKKVFKVNAGPTLLEVAQTNGTIEDAIMPSGRNNLDIAEIGTTTQLKVTQADVFMQQIKAATGKYDLIFIDTAPFSLVPSSLGILNGADYGIITVRRNKTRFQDLEDIQGMISGNFISTNEFIVLDTFHPDVSFSPFKKKSTYRKDKSWGLMGRINNLFARI